MISKASEKTKQSNRNFIIHIQHLASASVPSFEYEVGQETINVTPLPGRKTDL
jgi:hypothetical protein